MQFNALITNHGKHSDEKLAIACAQDIVQIGASAAGEQAIEGRKIENSIIDVMEKNFAALAKVEHDGLAAKGPEHLASSLDAHPEIADKSVSEIMDAVKSSALAKWFNTAEVEKNVRASVEKWLKASQHMHRDWFARWGKVGEGVNLSAASNHDQNSEHVKRWIDMHQGDAEAYRKAIAEHAANLAA